MEERNWWQGDQARERFVACAIYECAPSFGWEVPFLEKRSPFSGLRKGSLQIPRHRVKT